MHLEITSLQNPLIKQTALLLQKKHRKEQNLFLLEGIKNTIAALNSNFSIKNIFIDRQTIKNDDFELINSLAKKKNTQIYSVTQAIINKISDTKTPQPVVASVEQFTYQLADINLSEKPLVLVLDSINDPGNLGTIIRTADASGIQGVILNKNCVDLFSPKTLRSTMGSIFHLPIINDLDNEQITKWLKQNNFQIVASSANATLTMHEADFDKAMAIVMGSEAHGISNNYTQAADFQVSIPMRGKAESLNVAVATALLLYTARP